MFFRLPPLPVAVFGLIAIVPSIRATDFFFYWPATTAQCDVVSLNWENGVGPFTAWIVPIFGQPFIYDLPSSAYKYGVGSYNISLQLSQGTEYVVVMSDANGVGTGGSSEIQVVQSSNASSCLSTASSNVTSLDFTFTVIGQIVQCQRGFEMSWNGKVEDGPYNATIIPLDQGFDPYDVPLESKLEYESDWVLNMTAGSRFTVMMNSNKGYGRGGVTGVYQVSNSSDASCVLQEQQPTGTWPVGVATNRIDAATLPVTESARVGGSDLSGGAIAGVVIGAVAALALISVLLFFLLRRRKRRSEARSYRGNEGGLDLSDKPEGGEQTPLSHENEHESGHHNDYPNIEPYQNPSDGQQAQGQDSRLSTSDASTAGFAGLAAGTAALTEEGRQGGPGVAEPLPTKLSRPILSPPPGPTTPATPAPSSQPETVSSLKAELLDPRTSGNTSPPPLQQQTPQRGTLQVVNPDSDSPPVSGLPQGATHGHPPLSPPHAARRREQDREPTYRRHADAGRVFVDLPPLYTEIPRDEPSPNQSLSVGGHGTPRTPSPAVEDREGE